MYFVSSFFLYIIIIVYFCKALLCDFNLLKFNYKYRTPIRMSEEVLRSYRLTSMEEPTDEMLYAIMEKVAESARDSTRRAEAKKGEMLRIAIENANRKAAYIL